MSDIVDFNTHLEAYQIKDTKEKPPQPQFPGSGPHTVVNQFGTLVVNAGKLDRLLVPTGKSRDEVAPLPDPNSEVDHYKCYTVAPAEPFVPVNVTLEDQFTLTQPTVTQPLRFTVKKPLRLCNPVSKNGVDIKHIENHLMCYQVALIKTRPAQPRFPNPKPRVFLNNQFGQEALTASAIESLCVPSLKDPPG